MKNLNIGDLVVYKYKNKLYAGVILKLQSKKITIIFYPFESHAFTRTVNSSTVTKLYTPAYILEQGNLK